MPKKQLQAIHSFKCGICDLRVQTTNKSQIRTETCAAHTKDWISNKPISGAEPCVQCGIIIQDGNVKGLHLTLKGAVCGMCMNKNGGI